MGDTRTVGIRVYGFSHMLKEPEHTEVQKEEFVDIINKSGNQLLNIITDILDISSIEAKQVTLHEEKFNLNILLDEILDFFESSTLGLQLVNWLTLQLGGTITIEREATNFKRDNDYLKLREF